MHNHPLTLFKVGTMNTKLRLVPANLPEGRAIAERLSKTVPTHPRRTVRPRVRPVLNGTAQNGAVT